MKVKKTISLIVPCKNEAKILPGFFAKVPSYITEVLIVDNKSTDGTAIVAKKFGARVVKELRTKNGIGYGYAHKTGIKKAKGDYIVAMDGDDTYPVESIATILRYMEKHGLDFVSCNRLPLKNPRAISPIRQLGIRILNLQTKLLYGFDVKDMLTGMWIMKKETAEKLHLREGDWNFSIEIKLEALRHPGITTGEYHIDHFERENEISKQKIFQTGFKHAWYIVRRRLTTDNNLVSYLQGLGRYGTTIKPKIGELSTT